MSYSDSEVLAAFRKVLSWSDAEVMHYAKHEDDNYACGCDPIGYDHRTCEVLDTLLDAE